jgi:hypothetical protein
MIIDENKNTSGNSLLFLSSTDAEFLVYSDTGPTRSAVTLPSSHRSSFCC